MSILEAIYQRSPVPLQTLFINAKAAELYLERYGRKFRNLYDEFDRNQWLSAAELEAYQDGRLRKLIKHAYETVPYYSDLMRSLKLQPNDIRGKADLPKLPMLTKDNI